MSTPKPRPLPTEVWAIRRNDGGLVPPCDEDGTHGFMAWPSRAEAERGLAYQMMTWEGSDDWHVVQIIPGATP